MTLALALILTLLMPGIVSADPNNESETFRLVLPPNTAEAPNGDKVIVAATPGGTFGVHPKSVTASGAFTHTTSTGTVLASGTWTATDLLAFEFYGCGILTFPDPDIVLPPFLCGGALKLRVLLTVTSPAPIAGLEAEGILDVFCIVGAQAPESHDEPPEEGIRLVVPGGLNFNKIVPPNMNVFIKTP